MSRWALAKQEFSCHSKKRYWSEVDALVTAVRITGKGRRAPKLRTYRCPFCKGWHLTKREKR